jgi:hypothetical protein
VVGRGLVTVQFEGTGVIAGPPARGKMFEVGSADASEQSAAVRTEAEVRMVVDSGVGIVARVELLLLSCTSSCQLMSLELPCVLCDISTARTHRMLPVDVRVGWHG